jgi:hypothetical protein
MERFDRKLGFGASLCIICLAILTGCAVNIEISAHAQPEVGAKKRFVLQGPDPRQPGGDPAWPRYAQIVTRALEVKGFVNDTASPDLVIRVSYRIGDTQTYTTTTSTPIMGVTGTQTETVVTPNLSNASAPWIYTTVTTPAMGVVGTSQSSSTSSTSLRTIQVEALDAASLATGRPAVLWRTHARNRGVDDTLDRIFPFMIASMEDYFGASLDGSVAVRKSRDDPEVTRLSKR